MGLVPTELFQSLQDQLLLHRFQTDDLERKIELQLFHDRTLAFQAFRQVIHFNLTDAFNDLMPDLGHRLLLNGAVF